MQVDGVAMGFPVSPVVANIYMEMFEDLALRTASQAPRVWKRYVDDTFCVMERVHVSSFLDHLNSLCPSIKFTMESEEDGTLLFLDTLLTRRGDGTISTSVYRAHTGKDWYLQYSSHHPLYVKRGVASCLFHRARTVAGADNIRTEEKYLTEVLRSNGYPDHVIRSAVRVRERREKTPPKYTIYLPYVSGVSEYLRRVCSRYTTSRLCLPPSPRCNNN